MRINPGSNCRHLNSADRGLFTLPPYCIGYAKIATLPYNDLRWNSAIGYITPKDLLAGRQQEIHAERDRKLEEARKQRQIRRQQAA
jgi:hypothetical protein